MDYISLSLFLNKLINILFIGGRKFNPDKTQPWIIIIRPNLIGRYFGIFNRVVIDERSWNKNQILKTVEKLMNYNLADLNRMGFD